MTDPTRDPPRGDVHVLVVDDVAQNLTATRALLERPGLRVLTAQSGAEALELLLVHEVALALLDVQMPEMDGFVLAELMRGAERTGTVPIIFMTAGPLDGQRSFRGYEAGAVDYLYKPVDQRVLLSKVEVFVALYEQRSRLAENVEALERVIALNQTMVAVLTHDLRTPLQAVLAGAETLRRRSTDEGTLKTAAGISASVARMSRMISQLLDFSRIRSGSLRLERAPADLAALGRAVVDELRQAHPAARIDFEVRGDARGVFDADRIVQGLSNLVSNAVQHGVASEPVRLLIDGTDGHLLRGEVSNAGAMPEEVRQRLFEPFRSTSANTEGLGLGLYIVAQFLCAHGGSVQGEVVDGDRTRFRFTLPRKPGTAARD